MSAADAVRDRDGQDAPSEANAELGHLTLARDERESSDREQQSQRGVRHRPQERPALVYWLNGVAPLRGSEEAECQY